MNREPKSIISFAEFELDAARCRLVRDGKPLALHAKAFDLLVFLAENAGRVLTKDEILDAVWANQFVEEANLTVQISALRKALGERKDEPRFLVTVPGKGYKFVADVHTTGEELVIENHKFSRLVIQEETETAEIFGESKSGEKSITPPTIRHPSLAVLLSLGFAVCLVSLLGAWFWRGARNSDETPRLKFTRLMTNASISNATLTPDGKYVVYAEREENGESLWLRQIATGSQMRIAAPQHLQYLGLTVSPDNNFVYASVFLENKSNTPLWRIPLLGGAAEEIPGIIAGTAITFSPDGKQFVFTTKNTGVKETYLNVADADGSNVRMLLRAEDAKRDLVVWGVNPLAWSPDGSEIAVAVEEKDADGSSKAAIILVNPADGGEHFLLTPRSAEIENLTWTDADNLAFISNEKVERVSQIWTVSRASGETRRLTDDLQKYTRLASANGVLLSLQQTAVGHLQIADLDEKTKTIAPREILNEGRIEYVAWTASGEIFYTSQESGTCEIWRVKKDGTNRAQITSGAQIGNGFAISPVDGTFVFSSARSGKNALWLADADGKNIHPLISGVDDVFPDFTPDCRAIIFQRGYGNKVPNVMRVNLPDNSLARLTETSSLYPTISPDGSQVAYYFMSWGKGDYDDGWAINLISIADGAVIKKVNVPKEILGERFLRWHPSGAFLSQIERGDKSSNLFLIPINGGEAQMFSGFSKDRVEWFAWSPDGKQIAVSQTTETQDLILLSGI